MQKLAHSSLRLEYTRADALVEYSICERYWKKQPMTVETRLTLRTADKKTLEETAIICSSAHLHYSVHLDAQTPMQYSGTLCNVARLWTPPIRAYVSAWFKLSGRSDHRN